jgi:hypothetical protein
VGPTRGGAQLTEAGRGCRVGPREFKLNLSFEFPFQVLQT